MIIIYSKLLNGYLVYTKTKDTKRNAIIATATTRTEAIAKALSRIIDIQ